MKTHVILCAGLHLILASIYLIVLVLAETGVFNNPLHSSEGTARTVVTFVTQAFTIAYCAALVFFTQRIALYEIATGTQTLSAMHDKSSAWLGLVSSLSVLSSQTKVATDLVGISIVTLYLAGILVVHTTLPSTFSVTTVNVTIDTPYSTTLARQINNLDSHIVTSMNSPHDILPVYDTLDTATIGVWENSLYDIIPVAGNVSYASVSVKVNTTIISVDCGPLPDVVQTDFVAVLPACDFVFGAGKYTASIEPMGNLGVQVVPVTSNHPDETYNGMSANPSMLVVAYIKPILIVPPKFASATNVTIRPPWSVTGIGNVSSITMLGCNFAIDNSTAEVNTQTREITHSASPSTPVTWHEWTDPGISSDPLLGNSLLGFAANAPPGGFKVADPVTIFTNATNVTVLSTAFQTLLDAFLFSELHSSLDGSNDTSTIADLNRSLARAYAAVLWYSNLMLPSVPSNQTDTTSRRRQGEALIPINVLQVRIVINMLSLSVGLGAAVILLILVVVLIFRTRHFRQQHSALIDSTGLLPMVWLLGNEPRLANIRKPDLNALRAAGMYEITIVEGRRRTRSLETGKENDESSGNFETSVPLTRAASYELCLPSIDGL